MFKKGTQRGEESGGGTGCHAKTEVVVRVGRGFFFAFEQSGKMRNGDTAQVQGVQEKENHRGGCVGVTMVQNHQRVGEEQETWSKQ